MGIARIGMGFKPGQEPEKEKPRKLTKEEKKKRL